MVYDGSPARHLRGLASVIRQRLNGNSRCLYLNSPAMIAGMRSYLAATGLDVESEVRKGGLVLTSDQGHLVEGQFDVDRMIVKLEEAVEQALADGYGGLWASGDMTWEFGNERNLNKLVEYELALEDLFRRAPTLSGLCQYHADTLPSDIASCSLCTHQTVYINETLSRISPHYLPFGMGIEMHSPIPPGEMREFLATGEDV